MRFNDPVFFVFLPVFFIFWWLAGRHDKLRLVSLIVASLLFYGWAGWWQLLVLLAVGFCAYGSGILLEKHLSHRNWIVFLSVFFCAGLLFFFKYSGFAWANLARGLAWLGLPTIPQPAFIGFSQIPVLGISFYVLQAISYLLDVYNGRVHPTHSILHFFAYMAMFPKLLAGPIERGRDLLPQLEKGSLRTTEAQRWEGTRLIITGYFLKAVIADNLAHYVNAAFNAPTVQGDSLYWWLVVSGFAFQLYCDFRGYSTIAMGLAKWMGLDLTNNFKTPYLSTSLAEFWTRWHISLSNWLRDYIFFPLSRSRLGKGHQHLNMWITMLVSGLWHGAAWHYVLWGMCHAVFTSLERATQWPNRLKRHRAGTFMAWVLVTFQVWIAWVFFRANSVSQAFQVLRFLFSFHAGPIPGLDAAFFIFLGLGTLAEASGRIRVKLPDSIPVWLSSMGEIAFFSLLLSAAVFFRGAGNQFIYFQF